MTPRLRIIHDQDGRVVAVSGNSEWVRADERTIADSIVDTVCHCKPEPGHRGGSGYPECATAREAARAVLSLLAMVAQ